MRRQRLIGNFEDDFEGPDPSGPLFFFVKETRTIPFIDLPLPVCENPRERLISRGKG